MNQYRKLILLFILFTACISLSSCSSKKEAEESSSVVLNIYNWGDYIDPNVISIFTKETGIKVNLETYATNDEMYVKVKNGGTSYDLLCPSDFMIERMLHENLLQKIDTTNIPNYKNISKRFKNLSFDPNNEYSVAYMWGTIGIMYNSKVIKEPVDSWNILWDKKYARNIFMLDSERESIGVSLKRLGFPLNSRDPAQLQKAKQALMDQKKLVLAYTIDDARDKMIAGEAALGVVWSGDAIYSQAIDPDLKYVIPKEGSNLWFDGLVIPKTSKHKKEAEMFIDFLCRPEIALANTNFIGYSTANEKARELLPPEVANDPVYWPSDEDLKNCELFQDMGPFKKEYDRMWIEVLSSK